MYLIFEGQISAREAVVYPTSPLSQVSSKLPARSSLNSMERKPSDSMARATFSKQLYWSIFRFQAFRKHLQKYPS